MHYQHGSKAPFERRKPWRLSPPVSSWEKLGIYPRVSRRSAELAVDPTDPRQSLPFLRQQSWDEYTGEVLGIRSHLDDLVHNFDMYESLQTTQSHIEQWVTEPGPILPDSGFEEPHEDPYICYGTVCALVLVISRSTKQYCSCIEYEYSYMAIWVNFCEG